MKTSSRETAWKPDDARAAETAKTERLRALRLAKEAADRASEQSAAALAAKLKPSPRVAGTIRRRANEAR
jgi:hypothetical protein